MLQSDKIYLHYTALFGNNFSSHFFDQRTVKESSYETLLRLVKLVLALNCFPNSETNIFVGFIEHQFFSQYNLAPNLNSTVVTVTTAVVPPNLCVGNFRHFFGFSQTSKFQLKTTVYALVFTTNLQIHIVTCCIHLHIYHTSRTPYLFHSFSDFVVYVVTTLIFPKNQRQCASFSINVAILFLSFKRTTTVPNKLTVSTIPFTLTFHPHNLAVKSIILKNFELLQNNSETGTIFS